MEKYNQSTPIRESENRKKELLENMGTKIETLLYFQHILDGATDDTVDKTLSQLEEFDSQLDSHISPDQQVDFEAYCKIQLKIDALHTEMHDLYIADALKNNPKALSNLESQIEEIYKENEGLLERDNFKFVYQLKISVRELKTKHENIINEDDNSVKKTFINRISRYWNEMKEEDIAKVYKHPFDIEVVVRDKAWPSSQAAAYWPHSVFICYPEGAKSQILPGSTGSVENSDVYKHERLHNILDASVYFKYGPDIVKGKIEEYAKIAEESDNFDASVDVIKFTNYLASLDPSEIASSIHEEFIADFDENVKSLRDKPIPADQLDALRDLSYDQLPDLYKGKFFHICEYTIKILNTIHDKTDNVGLKNIIQEKLYQIQEVLYTSFKVFVEAMQEAISIGPKAIDDLHALVLILPMNKFRHAITYLQSKY
ncbi:MAG: hypothetical protein HQ402_02300 [Parcubacteria group bacterium]|nr:hypothetical protein [Parcubacteria group bacterium]